MSFTNDIFEQIILNSLKRGDFLFTKHSLERMAERGVLKADIISVGRTCHSIKWQDEHQTYIVIGNDSDGLKLSVCCAYEKGTLIVTVF